MGRFWGRDAEQPDLKAAKPVTASRMITLSFQKDPAKRVLESPKSSTFQSPVSIQGGRLSNGASEAMPPASRVKDLSASAGAKRCSTRPARHESHSMDRSRLQRSQDGQYRQPDCGSEAEIPSCSHSRRRANPILQACFGVGRPGRFDSAGLFGSAAAAAGAAAAAAFVSVSQQPELCSTPFS